MNEPRSAATVILARPAASGFELYMTRRSASSSFVPDAFVFPGGTVDAQDADARSIARTAGVRGSRLETEFGVAEASALLVTALRELFEEAGVLLATTHHGEPVDAAHVCEPHVQAQRERLRSGEIAFADFLETHDWYADAQALAYFSHWITPPSEPRRYDTRFFFAMAPADQAATADAFETHDGIWVAPASALERYREGTFRLVYPTIKHLERLSAFDSATAAWEFARAKPVVTVMPFGTPYEYFELPAELENAW